MICSNCGKNNVDGSAFCEECGTALETGNVQTPSPAPEAPVETPVEAPVYDMPATEMPGEAPAKKPDVKNIGIIAAAVAVVLVLLFTLFGGIGGKGYEKPIKQYYKALNNEKVSTYIKAFPKGIEKEAKKDDDMMEEAEADLEFKKESIEETYKEEIGKNIKIKHKVIDAIKLTKDEREELEDECEDELEEYYSKDIKISKAYQVLVKVKYKGDKGSVEEFETHLVAKVNGHWCLLW